MGFLGLGDYEKPGRGVDKNAPKKKRLFQFFEVFGRKAFNLIKLNLMFLLFCLPAWFLPFFLNRIDQGLIWLLPCIPLCITIGPAMAAMTKICRCYILEKPVFLWSDFVDAFKENFKQAWFIGILDGLLLILIGYAFLFYWGQAGGSWLYTIMAAIVLIVALVVVFANFYVFLVMISVELKLKHILKNSVLLAILGIKTNFITLIFAGGLLVASLLLTPLSIPLLLTFTFSASTLIVVFNSWQYVYRYLIHPYYVQTGKKDPFIQTEEPDEETIFTDMTSKNAE